MSQAPTTNPSDCSFVPNGLVTADCSDLHGALQPAPNATSASVAAMRDIVFRMAAMQPVSIDPESVKPHMRRKVRISKDPVSVAARRRRERISERIRILQRLVPGGTKMDTASMLDEAAHYVKFLKDQVKVLEGNSTGGDWHDGVRFQASAVGFPAKWGESGAGSGYRETLD